MRKIGFNKLLIVMITFLILASLFGFSFIIKKIDIKAHTSIANEPKRASSKIIISKAEKLIGLKPLKEVTVDGLWTKLGIQAFEYKKNRDAVTNTYYIKNNKFIEINHEYGAISIKNMCVADLDRDGKAELLYYYSFGSGLNITNFCCYTEGKQIPVKFGSIRFCSFKFIKTDMQTVEIGVWWPDIQGNDKNSIPIGKLYIKDKVLQIKLYDNVAKEMKDYITEKNELLSPYNQIGTVSSKLIKEISGNMTYEEIIKKLGATKDIGSGLYLACYHVEDKKTNLIISFGKFTDKCTLDGEELLKKGAGYH